MNHYNLTSRNKVVQIEETLLSALTIQEEITLLMLATIKSI